MKTFSATPDDIHHEWLIVDAQDVPLGRLASEVAQLIRGKHKPTFSAHLDMGDNVGGGGPAGRATTRSRRTSGSSCG